MIRADEDPAAVGTFDPDANGSGVPGYWTTGMVCTILGPDAMNHIQEEVALALEGNGITLDFADKGQLAGLFDSMTGIYGDGSDGDGTIAIATSLTSDHFYENLTINAGIRLNLAGRRLFVRDTLTLLPGAIISNNGTDAEDWTGGGPPKAGGAGALGHTVGGGGTGGVGDDTLDSSTAGGVPTPSDFGEGYGGAGGAGGNGSPTGGPPAQTLGKSGGVVSLPPVARPTYVPVMQTGIVDYQTGGTTNYDVMLAGGGGGGGGGAGAGGDSASGYGGSGGGGGGVALVCARILSGPSAPDAAARIEATGGDGGADLTAAGAPDGGGGGGGGGGTILLTTRARIGDPGLLVLDVAGGAGGLSTTGGNGVNGTAGTAFELTA